MKERKRSIIGSDKNIKKNNLKKSNLLLISTAIMIAFVMATPSVFTENDNKNDSDVYPVFGEGVSGDNYLYGEQVEIGTSGNYYRLAYHNFSGNDYKLVGWYSGTGYVEPSGELHISSTIIVHNIEENITSIGDSAFKGCISITSLKIDNGVKAIDNSAFYNCTGLTSITIPDSVTSIHYNAFHGCDRIEYMDVANDRALDVLPKTISLKEAFLRHGVSSIGPFTFSGCSSLKFITIPDSVTSISIGDYAFEGCIGISSFNVDPENMAYSSENGVLYDKHMTNIIMYPKGKIGPFSVPNSVISFDDYAFEGCTGLTSITIPDSVTSIGYGVFSYCTRLSSIDIPNSVTSIGNNAFAGCISLTSVAIPGSATSIGNYAFILCHKIEHIEVGNLTAFSLLINNDVKEVILRDGISHIEDYMFHKLHKLESITIPGSATSIGNYAFLECPNLSSIIFEGTPSVFGMDSFNLGTQNNYVNCTVYSLMEDGFLNQYKNEYTTFNYRPYNTYRITIEPNGGYYESVPNGWAKDGDSYYKDFEAYSLISIPENNPQRFEHIFKGWDIEIPETMPAENITIKALWEVNEYTITWKVGDKSDTQNLEYGTVITLPKNPEKESTSKFRYEFIGWDGFIENMTVSKDTVFIAMFKTVLHMDEEEIILSVKDGFVEVDIKDEEDIRISMETFNKFIDVIGDNPNIEGISISVSDGSIMLNNMAVIALSASAMGNISASIQEVGSGELGETILDKVGNRPVYRISIGNVSYFDDGLLTISLKYNLLPDEDPSNLSIWHLDDDGNVKKYKCTYDDGYVTFTTDHLSHYAIMYSATEAGEESIDNDEEFPMTYAAGIAAVGVILALMTLFLVRRKG